MVDGLLAVISETREAYPTLSKEELISLFVDGIERELPEILGRMELPKKESPISLRSEYLKQMRTKKIHRRFDQIERNEFLDQLYQIQKALTNGHTSSDIADTYRGIGISAPSTGVVVIHPSANFEVVKEVGITGYYSSKIGPPEWVNILNTRAPAELTARARERIYESPELLVKKNTSEYFGYIIDDISKAIEQMPELRNEEYSAELFTNRDIELPQWEQTIVRFKIKSKDFDEKMELWSRIDKHIRKLIENIRSEAIKKGVDPSEIDEINKNLFIDIELP